MTTHDLPVKLLELVHPLSDISEQEFHDHWRHPHATLVRGMRTVRRYVQNHRIPNNLVPDDESPYLGIVEAWFDNSASIDALGDDPQYVEHVVPDEPKFLEQSKFVIMSTTEVIVQANRGAIAPEAPLGDLSWSDKDAPMWVTLWQFIRDRSLDWSRDESLTLADQLGTFRYVINRSEQPDSDIASVRQFFWPSLTVFEQSLAANPEAFASLRDVPSSFLFLAQSERIF